jgi:hypothetical protein
MCAMDGLWGGEEVVGHESDFVLCWGGFDHRGEVLHDHSAPEARERSAQLPHDVAVPAADFDEDDGIGGGGFREVGKGIDRCEAVEVPLLLDGEGGGHGGLEVGEFLGVGLHGLEEGERRGVGVLEVGFVRGMGAGVAVGDAGNIGGEFDNSGELVGGSVVGQLVGEGWRVG